MKRIVYIGIDDTDNLESVGTGRVARGLGARLEELKLGQSLGVSRHQLLVHPEIRYTSHNSSKGLAIESDVELADFFEPCIEHMKSCWQEGSDPGLCICDQTQIREEINRFGWRAEKELLSKSEAYALAEKHGIFLKELGGDGGGVIGALSAVGLRSTGNNGRLVEVRGIRELKGILTVAEIIARSGIVAVQDENGDQLADNEKIDSLDWIRPTLINWQPVLRVTRLADESGKERWIPAERAHKMTGERKND
ncbi:MAG: hypothetical protein CVV42_00385 [Candidatus Riflebacteria bacterium HGW-Riflebacteria-2]|jgi:hypothetical protein|nr:MAG: hypothetical protein CVV42_00385 [Candidatus Riflebacteria bacterium HGW-Riflebacteria-2]